MTKKNTQLFFICYCLFAFTTNLRAQSNINYGPDYIVFDAEETITPLGNLWTIREPSSSSYLEYLFYPGNSPAPINDTYLEYSGPWQGAGSELEYKFTCPKTGTYQVAMRLHTPLRESNNLNKGKWLTPPGETEPVWWEKGDLRNDFFIKMEGSFTSGSSKHTETDLRTFHKFFGRGANKWGTCINLEHKGNNGVFYNLTAGEEYTFYLKGRSATAIVDYIAFYDTSYLAHSINNQGPDLALQLPEEIRPYAFPTGITLNPSTSDVRVGTSFQLEPIMVPANGNPNTIWSSSNNAVASVNQNGVVTAQGSVGEKATVTAMSIMDNALIATSEITLISFFNIPVSSISISPNQVNIIENDSYTLSTSILPEDADNKNMIWSSGNEAIATVDQNGIVTGLKKGTVKIRATSIENSAIFDEAEVNVAQLIPQVAKITKINDMTVDAFKTLRNNQIEIGEALTLEIAHSNITEFNNSGFGRLVVRYAINNGGTAVGPNLNIENIAVGGEEVTQTITYTVADPGTVNNPEPAVLQVFAAQNFAGINSLYSGFEVVPAGTLSIKDEILDDRITLFPNPAKDFVIVDKDSSISSLKVNLYSINGALIQTHVINSTIYKIQTNQLRSGLYILQFKSEKAITIKKLIIK